MAADISLEKTLPHNLEAERSILGAILLDDKAIYTVYETLRARDFYLDPDRQGKGDLAPSDPDLQRDHGPQLPE
jgi:hypothetical protein